MDLTGRRWAILGTTFRCLGMPADAGSDLAALLQGFASRPDSAAATVDFQLAEGAEGPEIELAGARWTLGAQDPLASQLEYILIDEAIRRTRSPNILHAGGVATPTGTRAFVTAGVISRRCSIEPEMTSRMSASVMCWRARNDW